MMQPPQHSQDYQRHDERQGLQPGLIQAPETRSLRRMGRKRKGDGDAEGEVEGTHDLIAQRRRQAKHWRCSNMRAERTNGHDQREEPQPSGHPSVSSLNGQGKSQIDWQANGQATGQILSPVNNDQKKPTRAVIKGGRWTEQDLRHVIAKALKSPLPGVLV